MKKKKNWNKTKPTASPTKQTHPRILKKKKKKKKHKIKNQTYPLYHSHVAIEITEKIIP